MGAVAAATALMLVVAGCTSASNGASTLSSLAALVITTSAATTSASPTMASPASVPPASGSTPEGIAWAKCKGLGDKFQCARVNVPMDWSQPDGKQIELAVIRHLASRPDVRIGSMFVNPGGPGQSGVDLVRNSADDFDEWGGGRFDVVSWDPRGTNASTPVKCFTSRADRDHFWAGVSTPDTPAESVAYQRKAAELAQRCGKLSGALLSHITTADTARDLDKLRALVGDTKITYVGLSYGTLIGQTYANLFPGRVRAMMLDGLVDAVDATTSMETNINNAVSSADQVFEQFVAQCQKAGRTRCALAGHGQTVAQRVADLFAKVRRAPIPAPHADPPGELSFADLQVSTFTPLRVPLTWPTFANDLEAAIDGDASALEITVQALQSPQASPGFFTSAAISCADAPARVPLSAWPAQISRFTNSGSLDGPLLGWTLWAPCAANWPAHATDRYVGPWNAKTTTPILLMSARYDPGTPYPNAQVAQKRLGNAVLVTLNGYGHPSYQVPSTCMDKARVRYLIVLVTPPNGTVCQPDQGPFG
ncbi:alpha/beta hydrolase [Nakamurella sp. PAMC28650]|uniref:alpha/beta hydrolase n=1 Tax=Nakamurella sp. PAMC28650 TaxID=2762325 RepID=UPI00164D2C52|nr:alpha/beta hydrolase [Nakamurella sp. PAMC28650]QNK82875.1 alpha/beta fold hydrolase [Nakamurella sp. PAMC28650]